jgi:hypothetical protein
MFQTLRNYLLVALVAVAATACGGGGDGAVVVTPGVTLQVKANGVVRPGSVVDVTVFPSEGFIDSVELYSVRPADGALELLQTFARPPFTASLQVPLGRGTLDLFAVVIDPQGYEKESPLVTVPIFP